MFNIYNCPHCNIQIQIVKVNCGVLRCGLYKLKNGKVKQVPKHCSKKRMETIKLKYGLMYGCGNPIKFNKKTLKLIKYKW